MDAADDACVLAGCRVALRFLLFCWPLLGWYRLHCERSARVVDNNLSVDFLDFCVSVHLHVVGTKTSNGLPILGQRSKHYQSNTLYAADGCCAERQAKVALVVWPFFQ